MAFEESLHSRDSDGRFGVGDDVAKKQRETLAKFGAAKRAYIDADNKLSKATSQSRVAEKALNAFVREKVGPNQRWPDRDGTGTEGWSSDERETFAKLSADYDKADTSRKVLVGELRAVPIDAAQKAYEEAHPKVAVKNPERFVTTTGDPRFKDFGNEESESQEAGRSDLKGSAFEAFNKECTAEADKDWEAIGEDGRTAVRAYVGGAAAKDLGAKRGMDSKALSEFVAEDRLQGEVSTASAEAQVTALDRALKQSKLPADVVVYRAMTTTSLGIETAPSSADDDFIENEYGSRAATVDLLAPFVGKTFRDPAYGSTSLSREVARGFERHKTNPRVLLRISASKGKAGLYLGNDATKATWHGPTEKTSEQEVLLPRDSTYKVTGIAQRNLAGGRYLTMLDVELQ